MLNVKLKSLVLEDSGNGLVLKVDLLNGLNHQIRNLIHGAIAQLGERLLCTQEVCGSIPHSSTIIGLMFSVLFCQSLKQDVVLSQSLT